MMRFKRILGAAALCVGVSGCRLAYDATRNMAFETCLFTDEVRGKVYYPVLANAAWKEYLSCHPQCDGKDFAKGFRLGYADYLEYGGCGGTRPLPPLRYWKIRNETPEGRAATDLWLEGFREGAAAAKASGKRELVVVPVGVRVAPPPPEGPPLSDLPPAPPTVPVAPPPDLPTPRSVPAPTHTPPSAPPSAPPASPVSTSPESSTPRSLPASPYNPISERPDMPPAGEAPKPSASAAPVPYSQTTWRAERPRPAPVRRSQESVLPTIVNGSPSAAAPTNQGDRAARPIAAGQTAEPQVRAPSSNPGRPAQAAEVRQEQAQLQKITENVQRIEEMKKRNTPRDPEQHYQVGMIAMRAGATKEGLRWLNSALNEDPTHAPTHKALTEYYQSIGDVRRAAEHRALAEKYAKDEETSE